MVVQIRIWIAILISLCTLSAMVCADASASEPSGDACQSSCSTYGVRDIDQVWLISTRNLSGCEDESATMRFLQFTDDAWTETDLAGFQDSFAQDDTLMTTFFLHGNRTDYSWAQTRGWQAYKGLVAKQSDAPATRFIIWAWPTDQVKGLLRDFREKADRSEYEGQHLAWLLNKVKTRQPINLIGYSYGARVVNGALHILGGGQLWGGGINDPIETSDHQYQVALMAAATHNDWLLEGQHHQHAYQMMDSLTLINNGTDRALRFYRHVERHGHAVALGFNGFYGAKRMPDGGRKVEQMDVSNLIGNEHNIGLYLANRHVMRLVADALYRNTKKSTAAKLATVD